MKLRIYESLLTCCYDDDHVVQHGELARRAGLVWRRAGLSGKVGPVAWLEELARWAGLVWRRAGLSGKVGPVAWLEELARWAGQVAGSASPVMLGEALACLCLDSLVEMVPS